MVAPNCCASAGSGQWRKPDGLPSTMRPETPRPLPSCCTRAFTNGSSCSRSIGYCPNNGR
eukprot:8563632-Lingulodinium_polyedra.AAC.1